MIHELDERRRKLPYDTDGAVIKVDSFAEQRDLGCLRAKHRAGRLPTSMRRSRRRLSCSPWTSRWVARGRSRRWRGWTPVFLSGSTVSNATLHNFEEIERKDIRVGDFVTIGEGG